MDDFDGAAFICGILVAAVVFIGVSIITACVTDNENEFIEIRYRNKAGGASKQLVENMVKNQFPSNTWTNVNCRSSSTYVKIRLANP